MNKDEPKYCEDFCPIYPAIEKYNADHVIKIQRCFGICEHIDEVVSKNEALDKEKAKNRRIIAEI